ncbi:hypothetical protein FF098_014915 [Parvularcula flava]|uniref:Uncharacterized protein n=1 Tax=Aquisalinus luteolus TaxID=1566827 RepID=A0A8J3A3B8_9PROT|nr:hypothetical protein [Aquisalinus luteolus]NHK29210.1 hypothetical protein [Aquisalinus luteolus]GGH99960.1 hypothetical protein GCM10011355_27130 [Aquisalinus luteolus]
MDDEEQQVIAIQRSLYYTPETDEARRLTAMDYALAFATTQSVKPVELASEIEQFLRQGNSRTDNTKLKAIKGGKP